MGVFDRLKRNGLRLFGGSISKPIVDLRARILFVSHEATRTGAPKIALNLLKYFAQNTDAELETILHDGGHLVDDFAKHSSVQFLNLPKQESKGLSRRVRQLVNRSRAPLPTIAICNSMETRFIAKSLAELNVPIMFLVHELPSSYTEADYETVFDIADKVVFPIDAVRLETANKVRIPEEKSMVLSQGLLNPEFGKKIDREEARSKIRSDLGIPEGSRVILGCGTLDLRKGIDHFAAVARQTILSQPNSRDQPFHFVWVGEGPRWTHSTFHYVQLDLQKSGIENQVHFVGERHNVEPYFFGSDLFLLPSRVDPFPCVVHEAMAAQLPIITFDQSGGACEAVKDGAGLIVPYADYQQTAQAINLLCTQEQIAEDIRKRSLERVNSEYRFEDYAQKLLKVAESVGNVSLDTSSDRPDYLPFAA